MNGRQDGGNRSAQAREHARRRAGIGGALAALLAGCWGQGPWPCDTRDSLQAGSAPEQWHGEIREGRYAGEVVVEDPANLWTGVRFTGRTCTIEAAQRDGRIYVQSTLARGEVELRSRLGPGDSPFAWGETARGEPVVLQHRLGVPVSLTVASYGRDGVLEYGACGDGGRPFRECHRGSQEEEGG